MRRVHQATGLVLLLLALFYGYKATQLAYYSAIGPGPGFFPLWLSILLGLLAVGELVAASNVKSASLPVDFIPPTESWIRIGAVLASLFLTAAFLEELGFIVTMMIFFVLLLTVIGRRSIAETVLLTAIGSFGLYYVFTHHLSRPLPAGLISF